MSDNVRVIGLTGGIGAGKSTVARLLGEHGAHVIDVDLVCRVVIEPGGSAHAALVARFGEGVVADGRVDRAALARIVFNDVAALADLTGISHPAANEVMAAEIAALPHDAVAVLDMAVLTEYPRLGRWPGGGYTTVVVVVADEEVRVRRLVESRGMSETDARGRIANQTTDAERVRIADHVVDNSGTHDELVRQVDELAGVLGLASPGC